MKKQRFHMQTPIKTFQQFSNRPLGWRKNNLYFYFPFLIYICVIYSIKEIFAKETATQKIFRSRSTALKISILFKMMNFIWIKPSLLQLFFIL